MNKRSMEKQATVFPKKLISSTVTGCNDNQEWLRDMSKFKIIPLASHLRL